MKNTLLFILALLPLIGLAQEQKAFSIVVGFEKKDIPTKAYISYVKSGTPIVDSVSTKNGAFSFGGTVDTETMARIYFDYTGKGFTDINNKKDVMPIYLEPVVMQVKSTDSLKKAQVHGSELNNDFKKYLNMSDSLNSLVIDLRRAAAKDVAVRTNFSERLQQLDAKQVSAFKNYIEINPNSYFSLDAVSYLMNKEVSNAILEELYAKISSDKKGTVVGLQLAKNIALSKITAVGTPAIDFVQNDIDGKPIKLSDFKGKYVLIDFWASWCGPCRSENPYLVEVYTKYNTKGFTILGVSLDGPGKKDDWLKAIQQDGLTWTQVSDLNGWKNEAALLYGIRSVPSNFLLDPNGIIIARNLRGNQLAKKLSEIFGKP